MYMASILGLSSKSGACTGPGFIGKTVYIDSTIDTLYYVV
jgi:hypothetical protein